MGRPSKARDKRRLGHELTMIRHLALMIGPDPVMPDVDTSAEDELLEAVYWQNRDDILEGSNPPEDAPWGWHRYESCEPDDPRGEWPRLRPVA